MADILDPSHNQSSPWWSDKNKGSRHTALMDTVRFIEDRDRSRLNELLTNIRMYSNRGVSSLAPGEVHIAVDDSIMSLNVCKSVVDAATAKVAKNKPRPTFLTSGGSYSQQKKAQNLEKYVDLVFYQNKVPQKAPRVFTDCAIDGTGVMQVYIEGKDVKIDRVFPGELLVDQTEGAYQEPRNMYRRVFLNREVLIALFPDMAETIRKAQRVPYDQYFNYPTHDTTADQLLVVSSWHLPSGPQAGDGRYTIAIENCTLVDEEWEFDWFPFVFLRWTDRPLGFWGLGIIEEIRGVQYEINRLVSTIQLSMKRLGVPWILVEEGSKVNNAHLTNEAGTIITYRGTPPIVKPNETVSNELFSHLRFLIQQAYDLPGLSAAFAAGDKPAGVTSAVGIREASDREQSRFAIVAQSYEDLFMELAKRVVAFGKKLNQRVVVQNDKYTVEQIDWKDVNLDTDDYVLKVFPSSSLPDQPAGRLDFVQELLQSGLISPDRGKMLLGFPDLDKEFQLDQAAHDILSKILDLMLEKGKYTSPEPFMDLNLAKLMGQAAYNRALTMDVPEDRLNLVRTFLLQVNQMQEKAKLELQRQQMMQMSPGSGMTAAPGPVNPNGAQPGAVGTTDVTMV